LKDFPNEKLHPDLVASIIHDEAGGFSLIHHPRLVTLLLADPDVPSPVNGLHNMQYQAKEAAYDAAIAEEHWDGAVFAYTERPYRVPVFDSLAAYLTDEDYWRMLAELWIDQENPEDFADEWRERFNADRPGRENMMTPDEQIALSMLPARVTIYRAGIGSHVQAGLSWSTSRETAEWFGKRFNSRHPLFRAHIAKKDIAAYWIRRGENEVLVLDPSATRDVKRIR